MRARAGAGVLVALAAGAALLAYPSHQEKKAAPAGRVPLAVAWPQAQRADLPGNLRDGPLFQPELFLDARTAIGTAPSPDGTAVRLLVRKPDDSVRELRRRPLPANPEFSNLAVGGDDVVWTETADGLPTQIWAGKTGGGPARMLTADTGDVLFYGSQWDLVVADGRVWWAAAAGAEATEIRSVALTGGAVRIRREPGTWAMSAWPWLTEGGGDQSGTTRLRNLATGRDTPIPAAGTELATCSPAWCRVLVLSGDGLVRIDLMHPDGSARQRVAGSAASAAVTDVAILDRFEILAEAGPDADLTGTEGLLIYDLEAGRTVDVSAAVSAAFSRNGVLWWATGDQDALVWHTLDLRTI
ncbi:MAG: hypothetical protein ABW000_19470 [Actinoplanes sp.]